ncbi:hypothetical protein [Streptomyces sp. NPDC050564]|uniref:hypothetical protein n=1 Tax=Streptomyces sp. NPDC050564 TaxID=3365631 RepID=UPI0037AD527C
MAWIPRLMIQVWTETLRNDEVSALMAAGYVKVRGAWANLVESCRAAGLVSEDAAAMARTMIALAQGFAAQVAVFVAASPEVLRDGLRALMSMGGSPGCGREGITGRLTSSKLRPTTVRIHATRGFWWLRPPGPARSGARM